MQLQRLIHLALLIGLCICASGCHSAAPLNCIKPPVSKFTEDRELMVKAGVKLEALPLDTNLETKFKDTMAAEYKILRDKEAAHALFLIAIECYIDKADNVKDPQLRAAVIDIIKKLGDSVVAQYAQKIEPRGGARIISGALKEEIDKSDHRATFYRVLQTKLGWQVVP